MTSDIKSLIDSIAEHIDSNIETYTNGVTDYKLATREYINANRGEIVRYMNEENPDVKIYDFNVREVGDTIQLIPIALNSHIEVGVEIKDFNNEPNL